MENNELEFHMNNFEGPLDLLLSLVKDKKMDLMEIDLSELASQYLKIINKLKNDNIDLAGEYLVMAATLLQLKAKMILEAPEKEIEVEKNNLLKQLVEYQQFKQLSQKLRDQEEKRKKIFIKDVEDYEPWIPEVDETRLDGKSDAIKLIIAMRKMFERRTAQRLKQASIAKRFNMTSAERRVQLVEIFNSNPEPSFDAIFSVPTINHFLLTIITLLDMAKKQEIIMEQVGQYDEIRFRKGVIQND